MTTTCKDCLNGQWMRTPTGRIKVNNPGQCGKANDLMDFYRHQTSAPCIVVAQPHKVSIWPDYDASGCPMFSEIQGTN